MDNENKNITLSFQYSIKNKKYTIEGKLKEKDKCNKIMLELFEKLYEISSLTWKELKNKPKNSGYETIPISSFNINFDSIKEELSLSNDSKIIIFRFCKQDYRILGVQRQDTLYIIGYDWNFNAYNHGN